MDHHDMVSVTPSWQNEAPPIHHPELYGAHIDCYYCPSRRLPRQASGSCYAMPSPFCPPVDQHLQAPHGIAFSQLTPAPQRFAYEHVVHPSQPHNSTSINWPFEHGVMLPPHTPTGDRWVYDPEVMICSGLRAIPYCPPHLQMEVSNGPYLFPSNVHEKPTQIGHSHRLQAPTGRLHLRNRGGVLQGAPASRDSSIPPERNQLNLARIEDGQDTRTTVMIKNIPNKMSDKDLITYIAKVCPRRIDFLYLRMDFQNGA